MKKTIKRIVLRTLAALLVYVVGGIALSEWVFPERKVDLTDYFRPGDKLFSKAEGFDQTILSINDGWLHSRLEVMPNAVGPPEHFHETFTETFTVRSGSLPDPASLPRTPHDAATGLDSALTGV